MASRTVAILGPGLLGGSIALALRDRQPGTRVHVWARRPAAAAEVLARGMAAVADTDLAPVVAGADVVVLCVPVGAMPQLATALRPSLAAAAIVTDVGSVKGTVVEALEPLLGGRFVGSHPMAGSERVGLGAARPDLFVGAACIVTPSPATPPATRDAAANFWADLGCQIRFLPPARHDETVALVSHLPHLLAAALTDFVCTARPDALNFCGNGFRDATRVAAGPAAMWAEILRENLPAMKQTLQSFLDHLGRCAPLLADDDPGRLLDFLARAKRHRDALRHHPR